MTRVRESEITRPLMADPRFRAFHAAERGTFPIGWNIGHDELPADVRAAFLVQVVPPERWLRAVLLRALPTVDQAQTIAHEIMHFVLLNEGYPYMWCGDGVDERAVARVARVANVPCDLLIAERLSRYGFPPKLVGPVFAERVALCRKRGYQTPGQMRALLEHLLDRERLGPFAFVK